LEFRGREGERPNLFKIPFVACTRRLVELAVFFSPLNIIIIHDHIDIIIIHDNIEIIIIHDNIDIIIIHDNIDIIIIHDNIDIKAKPVLQNTYINCIYLHYE
jgi:hypothetical protein